jgi:hypothetical protein
LASGTAVKKHVNGRMGDQAPIDLAKNTSLPDLENIPAGRKLGGIVAAGEGKKHQEKRPAPD